MSDPSIKPTLKSDSGASSSRIRVALFLLALALFFGSGATSLLYQVVWTRKLVLLFGTTAYAVSTVLSIFFLGLGLGSYAAGRFADGLRRPLLVYGVAEIVIGLWAVLFIITIDAAEKFVVGALSAVIYSTIASLIVKIALALVFLIVPVTLMGATLPILAAFVIESGRRAGFRAGTLYGVNTVGAVAGCAFTGFVLIAAFGYTATTYIGAAVNVGIGLVAVIVARRLEPGVPLRTAAKGERAPLDSRERLLVAAFAVSGFCALALEVLWTRLLAVIFLGTTYAFTTMLTTVLCGIALGSLAASTVADRLRSRMAAFATTELLIGVACIASLALFAMLPDRLREMSVSAGYSNWERLVFVKFAISFMVLFVPTFLFGATFPFVVSAFKTGQGAAGANVGRLYSANTIGGVFGALAGGYVLIPALGTHNGIVAMALVAFAMGTVVLIYSPSPSRLARAAIGGVLVLAVVASFAAAPRDIGWIVNQSYIPDGHTVIHFDEGVEATVAVSEPEGEPEGTNRVLWINAVQATASIEKGVKMNRLQGVLPFLFDRDPKRALFMCFGSGITAGTLGLFDFERIDTVEISKDVLGAGVHFRADNFDVLNNRKINFIVNDGRNHLLTTSATYDLITFEPMPLALAGVSTFYTQEYYEHCMSKLNPGGIVSQWVPLHSLNPDLVKSLVYTFTTVFPEYCAFFTNADLFILGSDRPFALQYENAKRRLGKPKIRDGLAEVGLGNIEEVLAAFFMSKDNIDRYVQGGDVMTDDRPWAEFIAPKLVYLRTVQDTLAELIPYYQSPVAILDPSSLPPQEGDRATVALDRRYRAHRAGLDGLVEYYGGSLGSTPEDDFRKSLEIDPNDLTAKYYLTQILQQKTERFIRWNQLDDALPLLEEAIEHSPNERELFLLLGRLHDAQKRPLRAQRAYDRYLELGGAPERLTEEFD